MAYRLSIADDVASSVRACAREQLAGAVARLERGAEDPVEAIHDARKHLKKTRALLRLVRPAMPAKAHRAENAALRDIAAGLSAARDADVLVETVDRLAKRYAGRLPAATFAELRAALAAEGAAMLGDGAAQRAVALEELRAALLRVEEWSLERAGWDAVVAGVARAYVGGRDGMRAAREEPTTERLHEWRKRVKDLWYHERLLASAWPPIVGAHGEEAHVLSELLGDEHDLGVLEERLHRGIDLPPASAAELDPLLELVRERREELRAEAHRLGRRVYAEPPKAFARRLDRYLRLAVAEQRAEEQPPA